MWSGIVTGVQVAHPGQKCAKGLPSASKKNKGSGGRFSWGNPHKDDRGACWTIFATPLKVIIVWAWLKLIHSHS